MFILTRTPNPTAADSVQAMCFVIEASALREAVLAADYRVSQYMSHVGHCVSDNVDESEVVSQRGTLRYAWSNAAEDWMLFETV